MKQITVAITGDNTLLGKFRYQNKNGGPVSDEIEGVKSVSYQFEEGETFLIDVLVYGNDDEKYKMLIEGADEAFYPTSEITLDGGYDNILARVTV